MHRQGRKICTLSLANITWTASQNIQITRTRLVNVVDLLSGDPQNVEITTQDRLTITTEAVVVFVSWSDFFFSSVYVSTQGPSPKWHIVVLPGAISRLCSVSPRQIPVWDTDTPPYLSKTPASLQRAAPLVLFSSERWVTARLCGSSFLQVSSHLLNIQTLSRSQHYHELSVRHKYHPSNPLITQTATPTLMTWSITFNKLKLHSMCLSMRNQFSWLHKQNWFHVHWFL